MKCDLCNCNQADAGMLCATCADMIPPYALNPPAPGTELALALAVELAPYLAGE